MKRQPVDSYKGPYTLGIDVSKYQGNINWEQLNQEAPNLKFAIIRTGDGRSTDVKFQQNWKAAREQAPRIHRGTYHYFRADRGGEFQADLVLRNIEAAGGLGLNDLPPAIDIEDGTFKNLPEGVFTGTGENLPPALIMEECVDFLRKVERELGRKPIVYTGQAFHWWFSQTHPDLATELAEFPLWLPSYTTEPLMPVDRQGKAFPWEQWSIWQYKSTGVVPGVVGACDMNRFRGDYSTFQSFVDGLHMQPPVAPPPGTEPMLPPQPPNMREALLAEARILNDQLDEVLLELASLDCKCKS